LSIDAKDSKILKRVLVDARLSYRQMAYQIGVSAPTVLSRINKLQYHRIIKSYSAIVDHEKLGYDLTAILPSIGRTNGHMVLVTVKENFSFF
jgi:DNA-binding Lrp family transcriptional regulator